MTKNGRIPKNAKIAKNGLFWEYGQNWDFGAITTTIPGTFNGVKIIEKTPGGCLYIFLKVFFGSKNQSIS